MHLNRKRSNTYKHGGRLSAFLIYLPIFQAQEQGVTKLINTPAKVRFADSQVPIQLVIGGPKDANGQLIGLGMRMKGVRQLIRMDYHKPNPGHGGVAGIKNYEIAYWIDGDFHYHVMKWKHAIQP